MWIIRTKKKPLLPTTQVADALFEIKCFLEKLNVDNITEKPLRYLAVERFINQDQLAPL